MRNTATDLSRYADALVALAQAADVLVRVEKDFARAVEVVRTHPRITRFMRDGTVARDGKAAALREILADSIHPILLHFLVILVEQDLFPEVERVAEAFFAAAARLHSQLSGEILAARELPHEAVEDISREVGRILGRDVKLRVRIDRSIMGGMRVRVGDFVIDGTVDRFLADARSALTG